MFFKNIWIKNIPLISFLVDVLKALSITFLETLEKLSSPINFLKSFIAVGDPVFSTWPNNSSGSTDPGLLKPLLKIFLSAFVNCCPAVLW